jgi:hypothetical protein
MAKASMIMPDGTKVQIEGTAEEVAVLIARCSSGVQPPAPGEKATRKKHKAGKGGSAISGQRKSGPTVFISQLADEGYFKSKRSLSDIQKKLEELGHIYAQTSISPALTRLTRKRVLRRIKEKDGWVYIV